MVLAVRPIWSVKPNWSNGLSESREWLTSILASPSGAEQRRAMRQWPRNEYEFDITVAFADRFWLDNFLHDTSGTDYWLPIFHMGNRATFDTANPRSIYIQNALTMGFKPGEPIVLIGEHPQECEVLEVEAVVAGGVVATTARTRNYPVRTHAYPAVAAKLTEQPKFKRRSDNVQTGSVRFRTTKGKAIPPAVIAPAGPMILDGLIVNSFHQETGRGGYFHTNSGTSEGQFVFIYAMYCVWEQLREGSIEEQQAAAWYKELAEKMLDAMGTGDYEGPILRQPVPDDPNTILLLHWLFAARGDIPEQNAVFAYEATRKNGNQLVIPNNARGSEVFDVYAIYPATSKLLYDSPFSAAFDIAAPAGQTQTTLGPENFVREQFQTTITIPGSNDVGGSNGGTNNWKVAYGYNNAALIPHKFAQEAYPNWTLIAAGYAACAPDTFRWFEQAMQKAVAYDSRPGKALIWQKLQAGMRRTAVKGQNLSDLREVLQPLPGFDAIPAAGNPTGMFCFSNHVAAIPPTKPGLQKEWTGYDFWGRDLNGDIVGDIPSGPKAQVQIGRGISDQWRTSTAYQDPDQYLYISMSASKQPGADEDVLVYFSATAAYDANTRWFARLEDLYNWQVVGGAADVVEYFVPISAFKTRLYAAGTGLPYWGTSPNPGQKIENFGLSIEMAGPYRVRIRDLRMVSGPSAAWVDANKAAAKKGSKMPFFPGAMPFAINADTKRQQFVGWNGSPFHGYQLPDFWWWLQADANYVHPNLTVNDLPIPAANGLQYPISPTNPNGSAKPKHALLCEQQLRFLVGARDKWQADGGAQGPFAHTFVLNTPARLSIGNPTPHTWVYTNDDPNTRWVGYQVRIVESLAVLGYLCRNDASWQYVNTLALDMAQSWLSWFNGFWTNPATMPPTDFNAPYAGGIQSLYHEPHAIGIVLRACVFMKLARPALGATFDALMVRCWQYLENRWQTAGLMKWTWSPDPANNQWYGFWHGEILQAFSDMLAHPNVVPAGIPLATVRDRMVKTQKWMLETGVKESNIAPVAGIPNYRDYAVLTIPPDEREDLSREFERIMAEYDPGQGLATYRESSDRLYEMQTYSWYLKGRAKLKAFEDFADAVKGRWRPFWCPTFMDDFVLGLDHLAGAKKLTVRNTGFTRYGGTAPESGRQDLMIQYRDGTFDCRRIISSAETSSVLEELTLDQPISKAANDGTVIRVSLMQLKRFNQDRIEINHPVDSTGVTTVSVMLRSAPENRQSLPAFYQRVN